MKKILFTLVAVVALALIACTQNLKLQDPEMFQTKSGVIGVFRQPVFYCSEASPQYIQLGDSSVLVKPMLSEEQDNLFFSEMKPGVATLYSYQYNCGSQENKMVLDVNAKSIGPTGVKIPEHGFCKIVISFLQGDKMFSYDDALLEDFFRQEKVVARFEDIPYCEVVDNSGAKVVYADKDSLIQVQYEAALADAADATAEEVYPLVTIDENSDKVTWNLDKTKVLMIAYHKNPDQFREGMSVTLDDVLFVYTDKEFLNWYRGNKDKVKRWNFRLNQLMGLPPKTHMTHFTAFWVDPKDIIRPAYLTDIKSSDMRTSFADELEDDGQLDDFRMWYKNWFDSYASATSGKDASRIWTRLGYTFDWAKGGTDYGLTEFAIVKDARVDVSFTKNVKTFFNWLDDKN